MMGSQFGGTAVEKKPVSRFGGQIADKIAAPGKPSNAFQLKPGDSALKTAGKTFGNVNVALGETALAAGTGAAASAVGGLVALGEGIYKILFTDEDDVLGKMVKRVNSISGYAPKTKLGQETAQNIAAPFQAIEEKRKAIGDLIVEKTGSPELATAAHMVPDVAASLFGLRYPKAVGPAVRSIEQKASRLGIDLEATKAVQTDQIAETAMKLLPKRAKSFATPEVVSELAAMKTVQKAGVDALYDAARSAGPAGVKKSVYNTVFGGIVQKSLRGYVVDDLPIVKARITELQEMGQRPWTHVSIRELEEWRMRVNRMKPAAGDAAQHSALAILKGQYDAFRDALFNTNMITGDTQAVTAWKNATAAHRAYAQNFKSNKVVKQLLEQKATPEQARNWIFGASDVGLNAQTGQVVRKLDSILGRNSPAMQSLRSDAMLNIIDPLFDGDLARFSANYERVMRKNNSAMVALFGKTELGNLHMFAKAIDRAGVDKQSLIGNVNQFIARTVAGHSLSVGQARMGLVTNILNRLSSASGASAKRKIVGEILGHDPKRPMIEAAAGVGVIEGQQTSEIEGE